MGSISLEPFSQENSGKGDSRTAGGGVMSCTKIKV